MDVRRTIATALCLVTLGSFLFSSEVRAEWWKFGSEKKTSIPEPKKKVVNTWWPWTSSPPKKKSSAPSTFQRFTSGTKDAWNRTVDWVNPFDNKKPTPPVPKSEPNTGGWFGAQRAEEKLSGGSWLSGERPTF